MFNWALVAHAFTKEFQSDKTSLVKDVKVWIMEGDHMGCDNMLVRLALLPAAPSMREVDLVTLLSLPPVLPLWPPLPPPPPPSFAILDTAASERWFRPTPCLDQRKRMPHVK